MPASSCMLPANTACLGVFVLLDKERGERGQIIHCYKYIDNIYHNKALWVRQEKTEKEKWKKKDRKFESEQFERDEKVWVYYQVHSVIRKVWLNFALLYFPALLFSPHAFAFCICRNNWDVLMAFKSFFQWCGFKDSGHLCQDQIQKHSLYRHIKSQRDGKTCALNVVQINLQAQGQVLWGFGAFKVKSYMTPWCVCWAC